MEASNQEHNYLIKILSTFLPTAGSAKGDVTKIQTKELGERWGDGGQGGGRRHNMIQNF